MINYKIINKKEITNNRKIKLSNNVINRPRKFMVLKMAKYGLKNMLIWS